MTDRSNDIDGAALDWAVRTADPDFEDWEAFAAWLAKDERHAARYDAIVAAVDDAASAYAAAPVPRAVLAPSRPAAPRRWLAGASIAAALAVVVSWTVLPSRTEPWQVETRPGAAKKIALGEGSTIILAGDSRLTLDRRDSRRASLDRGQALFSIRHDAANPYRVTAGAYQLLDVGTVFDVKHTPSLLRIAVSEGEVMLNPDGEKLRLPRGKAVLIDLATRQAQVSAVEPTVVGGWRGGQLSYSGARLDEVAADLSRLTGTRVSVSAGAGARLFYGTIDVSAVRDDPAQLGTVLGVTVRADGDGWSMSE